MTTILIIIAVPLYINLGLVTAVILYGSVEDFQRRLDYGDASEVVGAILGWPIIVIGFILWKVISNTFRLPLYLLRNYERK